MSSEAPLLQPGDLVERYRVEALIGEGATARVYRVRHEVLGTRHALKVLLVEGTALVDRMLQEARVQARLRHPHIVAVSDVLTWQGRPCLVLELVDGPSLEQRLIADGPLPWPLAVAILRPLVDAVAAAHAQGVLHRDLKPANVLLASGEAVLPKVTDFGLAKVFAEDARAGHTRRQVAMGTPGYMAPEQWADAATADARADVFGLAAMLYATLTARAPFPTEAVASLQATVKGAFVPLDRLVDCPAALCAVVARGLHPDPAERWPSAEAFGVALGEALHEALRAPPLPSPAPTLPSPAPPLPSPAPTLLPEATAPAPSPPAPLAPAPPSPPPPAWPRPFLLVAGGLVALALAAVMAVALRKEGLAEPVQAAAVDPVVHLPAMRFWQGDTRGEGAPDERPAKQVELPAFGLDRTEVRTRDYLSCVSAGACTAPAWQADPDGYAGLTGADQPIVGVSWTQAQAFCAWKGGRLPTEAEWEAAATWSATAKGPEDKRAWPWGEAAPTCARARFQGCGEGTLAVDALPEGASAFGLLGLTGNAWEWTSSTYPLRRVLFRRPATHYVLRGGAWDSQPASLRPTFRRHTAGADARPNTGFRCAWAN